MNSIGLQHRQLTRRYFTQLLASGATAVVAGCRPTGAARFGEAVEGVEYLTAQEMFGTVERGKPLPYKLPPAELAAAGLTPSTWSLEVVADPEDPAELASELTVATGTAFTYADLERMAKTKSVRFLKTLTCANGAKPLGTGLWEGVPLRDVVALTGVRKNFRRIWYYGFHNHDPKQMFRSSLPADRLFEDPIDTPPVILAYALNGELLSGKRGGPVRIIVPESYGFKSVKWMTRVMLSNRFTANDTYARFNNTTESWMKSLARFASTPGKVPPDTSIPLSGIAQVGTAGLVRVQVLLKPAADQTEDHWRDDRGWMDADILAPPNDAWGGRLPDADHPAGRRGRPIAFGFSELSGAPSRWPLRFATVHWAVAVPPHAPGSYLAYCRTIDRNGEPQPWPRTIQNSGRNLLHRIPIEVG